MIFSVVEYVNHHMILVPRYTVYLHTQLGNFHRDKLHLRFLEFVPVKISVQIQRYSKISSIKILKKKNYKEEKGLTTEISRSAICISILLVYNQCKDTFTWNIYLFLCLTSAFCDKKTYNKLFYTTLVQV